jgi:hypothetical protein
MCWVLAEKSGFHVSRVVEDSATDFGVNELVTIYSRWWHR